MNVIEQPTDISPIGVFQADALVFTSTVDATFDTFEPKVWTVVYDRAGSQVAAPDACGSGRGRAPDHSPMAITR